jgi:hypothetical protein
MIGDAIYRSCALEVLAPHLDAGQFADAVQAAKVIGDASHRSRALAALAIHVAGPDGKALMIALLDTVSNVSRSDALQAATNAATLTAKLGGSSTLMELRRAINDVCSWYP